jgi:dimethylaniline monooxygenase (N-oxide forming)
MCTGFDVAIEYFEQDTLNCLEYDKKDYKYPYLNYKCTFNPKLENIAMIGQNDGLFFTCIELQSMWAAKVFSGKMKLPSKEEMELEINKAREKRKLNLKLQFPYDHDALMDMLASELGILPDFNDIKEKDPELYDMIWNK